MKSYSGQLRALILFSFLLTLAHFTNGLECPDDGFDKTFLCKKDSGYTYCCDFDDYAKLNSERYLLPIASSIVIAMLAGCFLCCLCCPCCMLYKRRQRGTVYGRFQQPGAVVTVQSHGPAQPIVPVTGHFSGPETMPMPMPMPMATPLATPMPMPHGGVPMQQNISPYQMHQVPAGQFSGQQNLPPPPYSAVVNEGYAKQAPFNPNFPNN